jgi:HD-GYP domain-containing protein (c-di-GMP phosphodiesterase class II)
MQYRFALASATQAAEEQAWSDIEAGATVFLSELEGVTLNNLRPGTAAFERMTRWVDTYRPSLGNVLIVDPQWRVLFPRNDVEERAALDGSPGPPIEWIPEKDESGNVVERLQGQLARGKVNLPDGPHLAVAGPLSKKQGYVLIHRPVAEFEARSAALAGSLPAISMMTFLWTGALLSIAVYMILARVHDELDRERSRSATDTLRQTQSLVRTRDAVIFGLAKLADSRDPDTGDHLERISIYSTTLAMAVQRHPKFRDEITPAFIRLIGISSALHDIGKVGIGDPILLKRGPLTPEERSAMQTHARIGGERLQKIEQHLGGSNFLQMAREIAFAHHERWDGSGYPAGLSGTAIPLSARLVAIADIYDALSSRRVYKDAFPHEKCVRIIREEAGKHLDPDLVEVWLTIEPKFRSVGRKYADDAVETARDPSGIPVPAATMERDIEGLCAMATGTQSEHG